MAIKKDALVKKEFYLTKENAKLIDMIDVRMVTPSYYINLAIESTAQAKKFKEMRTEQEVTSEASESIKNTNQ